VDAAEKSGAVVRRVDTRKLFGQAQVS